MKKKEIKILYIITKLELGGAQKVCLALLQGLRTTGHHSWLISGNDGLLVPTVNKDRNAYLLKHFVREVSFTGMFKELTTFFQLVNYIKKLKQQHPTIVVHTHSTKAGLFGRWAAMLAGVRIKVHTIHGFGFHPFQNKFAWLAHYCLELATSYITTHYICVSSYDAKIGARLLPNFAKKHSIIRASVDHGLFKPAHTTMLENKPFIFGTIACFKRQKNMFDLLKAFGQCHQKNPHTKLEIVGDGHLRNEIEDWITKHQLQSKITLLGWQEDVADCMKHWNAFVLSSLWEGLPCAIVEARLVSLPVLAYDTGGIKDVITDGHNGLLFEPKKWLQLAQGMEILSTDKKVYNRLQKHKDDLSPFARDTMLEQHIDLYRSLPQ